jgi:hypothetical protein
MPENAENHRKIREMRVRRRKASGAGGKALAAHGNPPANNEKVMKAGKRRRLAGKVGTLFEGDFTRLTIAKARCFTADA